MASIGKPKGIRTRHPDYDEYCELWERCEDAAEGEHAIHAGGTKYLPMLKGEDATDYHARMKRTPFFNATWRTISGLKGMLFRKEPQVVTPAAIKAYLADVDMAGTPFDMFAQEIAEEVLEQGRCGVLVDHPPLTTNADGTPLTAAQADSMGLRPMLLEYGPESIINWKTARVNNALTLTMVVLKESAPAAGRDEYSHEEEDRYRELTLTPAGYRQRVFRINDKDEDEQVGPDIFPQMNGRAMMFIPFVFFGMDDLEADAEAPPLIDLVDMNLHHYTVSADYEHGCHYSGLPTPVLSGYNPPEGGSPLYIGGSACIALPDPNASAQYMEVQGDFEALRKNLEDKQRQMAVLGARMLENSKAAVEAADTLMTRTNGENSALAAFAQVLGMGLTKCLTWMAEWSNAAGEVAVTINREFLPSTVDSATLTAIVAGWQAGAPGFSGQNVYAYMQRADFADSAVTYEEEQERIAAGGPRMVEPL